MTSYVIHGPGGNVTVVRAESPSAALRTLTTDPIKTTNTMLTAGDYATVIPTAWR